jgi:exo-beta-1,3-glucanase (GH17 family)/cellulose synthase/poly-beta-1,6-N-acetylglucosamine synthase-like glycosyltransferase
MRTIGIIIGLVACAHAAIWLLNGRHETAASVPGKLPSVSYNRFAGSPSGGEAVPEAQIRADLAVIARQARAVRTYSSTRGLERVPKIAADFGLKVTLGAWIDKDDTRNEREIASALRLARENANVTRLIVGNETVFRHEKTADDLAQIVQRVRQESPVPVAVAENWRIFIDHPVLADAVDCIFAHIIPYWEGLSEGTAVDQSLVIYDKLRQAFPRKHIVIGEFGWPSAGYNFLAAAPSPAAQAAVLRNFVARADTLGLDYNIVEAIDQPQKLFEGSVGPYWGIFDASLRPKFAWSGPIVDPERWKVAAIAVLIGVLLSIPILGLAGATAGQAALLAITDNVVGNWWANVFAYWHDHYFLIGEAVAFAFGLPLLLMLVPIVRSRIEELGAIAFRVKPQRLLMAPPVAPQSFTPKVSIHIPAYREPPEMLLRTLDAVSQLSYPNFECVVVINNTPNPAFWRPIERRCRELGERFKFVRVENLVGFKAAALRLAMAHTADDVEIIGVLDADYVVHADWLRDLVAGFADPAVGLVQAPQDHRDGHRSIMHAAMNAEYAGFFDIGMVERNEANAIVVHGTMCLIRRSALDTAGGWSSETICEDTDLGLNILERGWRAHYTNRRYGWGLLPQDYQAFKAQRYRWAMGAVQIIKKHWRRLLPGASPLYRDQKHAFAIGWLGWLGAESVAVASAVLNLVWVPFIAMRFVTIPDKVLTLPIIAAFMVTLMHFVFAYRLRVAVSFWQMIGAMFVFMSTQWTVARAVGHAAVQIGQGHFHRTPKGSGGRVRPERFAALSEGALGGSLVLGAIILLATNIYRVFEIDLFAAILLLQSLPFLSAVALATLERSRVNEFPYWHHRHDDRRLSTSIPIKNHVMCYDCDLPNAAEDL